MTGDRRELPKCERRALAGVIVAHAVFPLLAASSVALWPGSTGNGYSAASLLLLPVMFVVIAVIIGPLVWRAWRGGRIAPWLLAAVIATESWLYWNGSRTPSWAERSANDRFSFAMAVLHALAAVAALLVATAATFTRPSSPVDSGSSTQRTSESGSA